MKFNYKRSLLSIAAATALAVSSASAGYIPLSDATDTGVTDDGQWTLFGVTGLKANGAGAGTSAGTFSIADTTANAVTDPTQDEVYVEGFLASTGEALGKVKVYAPYSQVEVRIDTTGAVFNSTEPVRTMYVTMTEGGGAAFAVTYRASLEGRTMQYSIEADGSNAHTITISSNYTYNNPGLGQVIQEIAGLPGSTLAKLDDVVDYDFSDNPLNYAYYDKDTHQDTAGVGEYLRVYSYDAATETWKLYDSRNAVDANDFTELEKGKAYWAKMNNNTVDKVAGLVLGSSSISAAEYAAAGITDGWNLLAFDNENPYIRKSDTGLLVALSGNAGTISIYDASGNHKIDAILAGVSTVADCQIINAAIKQAKVDGNLPNTFTLRAYPITEASGTYSAALISNKRFIIQDAAADMITNVATLTGANPYTITVTGGVPDVVATTDTAAVADLDNTAATAAMSKYGEYGMVIEPLVGDADGAAPFDTAASIAANAARVHLQSAATDAGAQTALSMDNTAAAATAITNTVATLGNGIVGVDISNGNGNMSYAFEFDANNDGTSDTILVASRDPFYVRDHTFTRVFDYTDVDSATGTITASGTGVDTTFADANDATDDTAALADSVIATGLAASSVNVQVVGTTEKLAFITSLDDANEFQITENTSSTVVYDTLKDTTTDDNLAKGAIKGVYSLTAFASAALENVVSIDVDTASDEAGDTVGFRYILANGTTYTIAESDIGAYDVTVDAEAVAYFDLLASILNADFATNSIDATATHTVTAAADVAGGVLTITGADVVRAYYDTTEELVLTAAAGGPTADLVDTDSTAAAPAAESIGKLKTVSPDLASDLKFNAVYSPNYVTDGPLYTMKQAGYTLKAVVTGTTDLSDGSVTWDSVDLTRTPSEWLNSQDYNLFEVTESSGYWSFLEASNGANPITISNAEIKPLSYTHHFNENGTNYNSVSGNVALTIDGLDADTRAVPVVSATVAGSVVELANTAGGNIYSGKLSSYEIEEVTRGFSYEVLANVADGLGYNLKSANVGLTIDFEKPAAPAIALGDGTSVAFTSTSADVAGYYIFNGQIPEESTSTAANFLVALTAADAAAYGLCQNTNKLAWDEAAYDLNVIAIDGAGTLGKGNVSDTTTQVYVPMLKDAVRVESANLGEFVNVGTIYDTQCVNGGAQTVNYGMGITTETDLYTAKLAYKPENVTDTTATPITLYVYTMDGLNKIVASIQYAPVYAGKSVYIEVNSKVYSLVLPTANEINGDDVAATPIDATPLYGAAGVGADSTNPLNLDDGIDDTAAGTVGYAEFQTDQKL